MTPEIVVLLSLGTHPQSGRVRPAAADARALAFALTHGGRVRAVHAGDASAARLRDYLGFVAGQRSLARLDVLEVAPGHDIRPALAAYLATEPPDLIVAGSRAEAGEGSGTLAYDMAAALDWPIVPAVADMACDSADRFTLTQALPRGRRRALGVAAPVVVTCDDAAAPRPIFAWGRVRRGELCAHAPTVAITPDPAVDIRAARARPKRLQTAAGGSAADRLRAASETQAGRGNLLVDPEADDAARAIVDYLRAEGFIKKR